MLKRPKVPAQLEKLAGAVGARINVLDEWQQGQPGRRTIQFVASAVLLDSFDPAHVSRLQKFVVIMGTAETESHRSLPAVACGASKLDRNAAGQVEVCVLIEEQANPQVKFEYFS